MNTYVLTSCPIFYIIYILIYVHSIQNDMIKQIH